ncbi:hypothetical protein ACHAXA_001718 [Cyclostephanos tholiformis]|uniref:Uncharacterized protein n=1 Tax=Cyclostephanos tholiformis TaxID=382380 RepID=A0ABD3RBF2_9STRA
MTRRRRCYCILPRHFSSAPPLVSNEASSSSSSTTTMSSSMGLRGISLIEAIVGTATGLACPAGVEDHGCHVSSSNGGGGGGGGHHRDGDAAVVGAHYRDLLILQCHSVGVLWNGLFPLLFPSTTMSTVVVGGGVQQSSPLSSSYFVSGPYSYGVLPPAPMEEGRESENVVGVIRPDDNNDGRIRERRCDERITRTISCRRGGLRRGMDETSKIAASARALYVLTNNFRDRIRRVRVAGTADADYDIGDDAPRCDVFRDGIDHLDANDDDDDDGDEIPIILLLLPPNTPLHDHRGQENEQLRYCYYSRTPANAPDNPFALRLLKNENNLIRLSSLSAYISTLGGGFFLCRYLSTAISLARRQCAIALMRNDVMMALKCRINEGYCYIHGGRLNRGKRLIRRVLKDTMKLQMDMGGCSEIEDDRLLNHTHERELSEVVIIKNMCRSALRFADLIREASSSTSSESRRGGGITLRNEDNRGALQNSDGRHLTTTMDDNRRNNEMTISSTHDDYQRIRIVRDRRWR